MTMRFILTSCLSVTIASLIIPSLYGSELPTIARLVVREGTVIVSEDKQGELRYSLIDRNGEKTEVNLSQAQLAKKYPDLSDRLEPATANGQIPYAGVLMFDRQ